MEHSSRLRRLARVRSGQIDLNALLLFYETVNARSINKTAAFLDMPKSNISRRLRLLEKQFNSTLLRRGPRSLGLAETGQALYERCQRIVEEIESASLETAAFQDEMSGVLRVSMPSFFVGWIAEAIAEFAEAYPAIRLDVQAHNRHVDVAEEPFDIAIHFGKPVETYHPSRVLAELPRNFYATPSYLTRHGTAARPSELTNHQLIVHQYQLRDEIFAWYSDGPQEDTLKLLPRAVVNNALLVRKLVLRDLGLGLMPDIMCVDDVAAGRLIRVPLDWKCPSLVASATYLARRYTPAKTRSFLDHIAGFLRQRTLS